MHGATHRILCNLLTAAKAIGDEKRFWRRSADSWKQDTFSQGLRDGKFFLLEAKRACHAAASRVEKGDIRAGAAENFDLGIHLHQGLMVTVSMQEDCLPGEIWRLI